MTNKVIKILIGSIMTCQTFNGIGIHINLNEMPKLSKWITLKFLNGNIKSFMKKKCCNELSK